MNPMLENRVAFTGHRTYPYDATRLRTVLEELYTAGNRIFLSGMAVGFDLAAAEAVLSLRERHADVVLIAVVPFRGQAERFSEKDRERFYRILAEADKQVLLSERYHAGVYRVRNNFLVDHAATLVTWYDGHKGGTHYTIRRALYRHRRLIHLHPATPPDVRPDISLF